MDEEIKILARGNISLITSPHRWKIPFGILFAAWLAAAFPIIRKFTGNFGQEAVDGAYGLILIGTLIIPFFVGNMIFIAAKSGKPAEYTADSEKFTILEKHKPAVSIYYSDVRGVKIEQLIMQFYHVGYKVTITTEYRTIVYYYAFGGPHSQERPDEIPFAIIGKNIPTREPNSEIISGEDYNENAT